MKDKVLEFIMSSWLELDCTCIKIGILPERLLWFDPPAA